MKKYFLTLFLLSSASAHAQNWSLGVSAGPFVFGDFARRTLRIGTEEGSATQRLVLSATTRPGVGLNLERRLSGRFAIRAEGTFTRSRLAIKGSNDDSVSLEAGDVHVTTWTLPLIVNINRGGTFRFHVLGGPAYASYKIQRRKNAPATIGVFEGTRSNWGYAFGGGVEWKLSDRFSVEGGISDVSTESPFDKTDFPAINRVVIPRPHNIHTTAGLRLHF